MKKQQKGSTEKKTQKESARKLKDTKKKPKIKKFELTQTASYRKSR